MRIDRHTIRPAVISLIAEELAASRGVSLLDIDTGSWQEDTVIGGDALPADSIELVSLATSCADRFGLQEMDAGDYLLRYRSIGDWADLAATGIQDTGAVTFRSSGTTGQPKSVRHSVAALNQEVRALADLLTGARRIVSLVPAHHIYGFLFTVLLPAHLGIPAHHEGSATGLPRRDLQSGDWLIGFPLRWRQMIRLYQALPPGVSAVTSTSPCSAELIHGMEGRGLERMLSIYGSTETAGVGYRFTPDAPYALFDHWSWTGRALRRRRTDGEEAEPIEPEDELFFEDERHFLPQGRKDSVVQVAGRNIQPARISGQIARHALVERCSVSLDDATGEARLNAHIVLAADAGDDAEGALRDWIRRELSSAERPTRLAFVSELPRTSTGKLRGWAAEPA